MPFLRVIRDKRGYETTYLIHWYREGARQRSRVLYVFRTPGGVRVGREPLDPDVMHELEARHPEIAFDWATVTETRQVIDTTPKPRWPRKRRDADDERPPAAEAAVLPAAGARQGGATATPAPPRLAVPSAIQGSTSDEQIAFLALWYSSLRDRILLRTTDPARREALLSLAERLNPAGWTDADEIAAGLPRAAEALERLSRVLSRRRRKSRRTPTRSEEPASPAAAVEPPAVASEPPAVSVAEAPAATEAPAQAESAPLGAHTDTSPAGE